MTEGTEVEIADLPPKLRDAAQTAGCRSRARAARRLGESRKSFYDQVASFESALLTRRIRALRRQREQDGAGAGDGPLASLYQAQGVRDPRREGREDRRQTRSG